MRDIFFCALVYSSDNQKALPNIYKMEIQFFLMNAPERQLSWEAEMWSKPYETLQSRVA